MSSRAVQTPRMPLAEGTLSSVTISLIPSPTGVNRRLDYVVTRARTSIVVVFDVLVRLKIAAQIRRDSHGASTCVGCHTSRCKMPARIIQTTLKNKSAGQERVLAANKSPTVVWDLLYKKFQRACGAIIFGPKYYRNKYNARFFPSFVTREYKRCGIISLKISSRGREEAKKR